MRTLIHEEIATVDPERWDSLGDDPFSAHATLAAIEEAGMRGIRTRYVVLENGEGWVAAAPVARVAIDAERLTHGSFRRLIRAARRLRPEFLNTALTVCGTPLSVGNPPARIAASADRVEVLRALAGVTAEIARQDRSPWWAFKEFGAADLPEARSALGPLGWTIAPSETNHRLPVRWAAFEQYLGDLRSSYRTKVVRERMALARAGVVVTVAPLAESYDDGTHALYEHVVDRAAIELERLTPRFFRAFGRANPGKAFLIRMEREGRCVGWVAVLIDHDVVIDLFHGIDYAENERLPLYFGQLAAVIGFAIDRGARDLVLGQSTSVAKARFGAEAVPLWMAVRHASPVLSKILRVASGPLFPIPREPERTVFRAPRPEGVTSCSIAS